MAVGDERAHVEPFGQREGLPVVALCLVSSCRAWMSGDLAEEPERPGLVALLPALAGQVERPRRGDPGLVDAAGRDERLAHAQLGERLPPSQADLLDGGSCRRHEVQGVLHAPFQDRERTQFQRHRGDQEADRQLRRQ